MGRMYISLKAYIWVCSFSVGARLSSGVYTPLISGSRSGLSSTTNVRLSPSWGSPPLHGGSSATLKPLASRFAMRMQPQRIAIVMIRSVAAGRARFMMFFYQV